MGLSTGFLGGLTLTYSLLYLSLYLHRTNRANQHRLLSQQSVLLNSLVDPLPSSSSSFPPTTTTTSRTRPRIRPETLGGEADEEPRRSRRGPLTETLKDRWNAEMEGMVRRVQETDWSEVRERWETRGVNLWRNLTKD